jgi:hypothetical protein
MTFNRRLTNASPLLPGKGDNPKPRRRTKVPSATTYTGARWPVVTIRRSTTTSASAERRFHMAGRCRAYGSNRSALFRPDMRPCTGRRYRGEARLLRIQSLARQKVRSPSCRRSRTCPPKVTVCLGIYLISRAQLSVTMSPISTHRRRSHNVAPCDEPHPRR